MANKQARPYAEDLSRLVLDIFSHQLPFARFIGMEVQRPAPDRVEIHLPWKDELMGNPLQKILHGGVTATLLDTVGGLVAILHAVESIEAMSEADFIQRLAKMGTIDMRVDYLLPGRGSHFIASAEVIRKGSRVAVCRMELHNEHQQHIAFGTGTYMIG